MAWSCSEWLGESSLANEASQCDASPLLRNICVCVCMQVCGTTYIWYAAIIQHSCLLQRQRREKKKVKKRELKFESNRKVKLHFEILMYSAFVRAAGLTTASSKICTQVVWESDRV